MLNVPLVDLAIGRVAPVVGPGSIAVNVHAGRRQLEAHLQGSVHLSVEEPLALGTAGAVAHVRTWLDGRPVLVVNVDAWHAAALAPLVERWDGKRVCVLVAGPSGVAFGPRSPVVGSILPWSEVASLPCEPSGLWEVSWRAHAAGGRLQVIDVATEVIDCGTPRRYLAANLAASGGDSVVGPGAVVEGRLVRSVVWPGGVVRGDEVLVDCIRVGDTVTVDAR